ncbi:MAG TPA: PilZ domain-containing protein [Candidatus Acidoferrales bacterium]
MIKLFDALKRVQKKETSHRTNLAVPQKTERRRCPRWIANVPVFVYGHNASRQPFHEEAYSANVSEAGALLVMKATVRPGQTLLVTNKLTQEEQECRVAYVSSRDPENVDVAVEFDGPTPDFWRLPPGEGSAAPLR